MARKEITTSWDRENRNNIDSNFKELYNESTSAGMNAEEAKQKALQAVADSTIAKEDASIAKGMRL